MALPYWATNGYLVVSRVLTTGDHHESVICEANICSPNAHSLVEKGETRCTQQDLELLGPAGGMRCADGPITLDVPPTAAKSCTGRYADYVTVPGFHDPRIFYSGRGEPLMIVNTQQVFRIQERGRADPSQISICMLRPLAHRSANAVPFS